MGASEDTELREGEVGATLSKGRGLFFRRQLPLKCQMASPDGEGRGGRKRSLRRGNLTVTLNLHHPHGDNYPPIVALTTTVTVVI